MPRGHWDWGVNPGPVILAPEFSGAELAMRLGAIPSIDRLGEVIVADSFEHGLATYSTQALGTGGSVTLSAARSRSGRYSALLTAGSAGFLTASISRALSFQGLGRHGFEFAFALASLYQQLRIEIERYTGTQQHLWAVRIDENTDTIQVLQSDGTYATVATIITPLIDSRVFHSAKLVVDLGTRSYVRFRLAAATYDLTAYSAQVSNNTSQPLFRNRLVLLGRAGFNDQMYTDDWIHTHQEP
ncbi:MAG: hypothetical protein QN122_13525 [Armatimonadota bacterium]|nr:hypothetical protein [Armatimonadota bacterium]